MSEIPLFFEERLELLKRLFIEEREKARHAGLPQSQIDFVVEYHLKGLLSDLEGNLPEEYLSHLRGFLKELRR